MRRWRLYLWPSLAFGLGVLLWPVAVFFTNSTLHMLAHASWAEVAMLAGAVQLALVRGKLTSRWWTLSLSLHASRQRRAFLIHEQNPWLFSRSAFLHHAIGWTLLVAAIFPLGQVLQPRRAVWRAGFARDVDRARGDAVLRPRRRADLRPPLRPGGRPAGEARCSPWRSRRSWFPGVAFAHATLTRHLAADPVAPSTLRRRSVVLRFDQSVTATTHGDRRLLRRGHDASRAPTAARATGRPRAQRAAARGSGAARPTRCAGGRPRPTGTRAPASTRSASA